MANRNIELTTADGPMPAYEAAPEGEPRGGVVVVQEAFGITSHIEDVCQRLASAGWTAVAPALFHRQGSPVIAYDDLASVMPVMGQLNGAGIDADLDAALEHLQGLGFGPSRCGAVGFCMGGTVAFVAGAHHDLGAAVSFYGGGVEKGRFGLPPLVEMAPELKTPWLGLYGDLDKGIPPNEVEALREAAGRAAADTEVVRYPDAEHGFNCDDRPAVYNEKAAADAWRRTLSWFEDHIERG